jgi:hypothetical protein
MYGVVILPLAFWFFSRRKPMEVARGFSRALVLAFGTSSSTSALPVGHTVSPRSQSSDCTSPHEVQCLTSDNTRAHLQPCRAADESLCACRMLLHSSAEAAVKAVLSTWCYCATQSLRCTEARELAG